MAWISRILALFSREKLSSEQKEELDFHLSMREQLNVVQGMPQEEARRDARLRFGNPSLWRERMSEIDLMILPQTVLQDLLYGGRMLWRNAGFTIGAVLALAIGIGVNTAALTAYKAFFQRPLDAYHPGQMVNLALTVRSDLRSGNIQSFLFSYLDYQAYRSQMQSFSGLLAVSQPQNLTLTATGGVVSQQNSAGGRLLGGSGLFLSSKNVESAMAFMVSENYFSVLGITALRGRLFGADEALASSSSPAVLISENYWQKRFAGEPGILGKTVRLNGVAFTLAGITPHNFVGTNVAVPDFWLPLSAEPLLHPNDNWIPNRENQCLRLYGRLASGGSIEQAQLEMTQISESLRRLHDPHSNLAKPATALVWPGSPFPLPIKQYAGLKYAISLITVAVWMVLLIACANVASLQLARAASRQNELSMRLSLGASRLRIIRQLLTESALLGLLAGTVALFVSWASLQVLVAIARQVLPSDFSRFVFHINPDLGIFTYAFALSLVAGVLFGLAPALESSSAALSSAMHTKAGTSPVRSRRMRDFLMAAQVAISLMLMIAGAMLIRSSIRALAMDTGYNGKQIVDFEPQFPHEASYSADRKAALVRDLRTRLAALPGVAAITSAWAPDGNGLRRAAVSLNGEKPSPQNTRGVLYYSYVQANYFRALGIPLLLGRGFETQVGKPEPSVILSASSAQLLWPGQNPIGRKLRLGTDGQFHGDNELMPDGLSYQVIGIARDTRGVLMDGSDAQQIYVPLPESRLQDYPILIRTQSDPKQFITALAPVISSVDSNLAATASTLDDLLRLTPSFVASSLSAGTATTVGSLGLLLACMGIYGTVSYIVVLRTREVGIRMALGAKKGDILALMLRESTRPVLAGLTVGIVLAVGVCHLLRGVLYGVSRVDGISFVGVSVFFMAIALVAAYLPSRRAMRVDPMVALRYE